MSRKRPRSQKNWIDARMQAKVEQYKEILSTTEWELANEARDTLRKQAEQFRDMLIEHARYFARARHATVIDKQDVENAYNMLQQINY